MLAGSEAETRDGTELLFGDHLKGKVSESEVLSPTGTPGGDLPSSLKMAPSPQSLQNRKPAEALCNTSQQRASFKVGHLTNHSRKPHISRYRSLWMVSFQQGSAKVSVQFKEAQKTVLRLPSPRMWKRGPGDLE